MQNIANGRFSLIQSLHCTCTVGVSNKPVQNFSPEEGEYIRGIRLRNLYFSLHSFIPRCLGT